MPRKKLTLQQQIDATPEPERAAAVAEMLHDLADKILSGEVALLECDLSNRKPQGLQLKPGKQLYVRYLLPDQKTVDREKSKA